MSARARTSGTKPKPKKSTSSVTFDAAAKPAASSSSMAVNSETSMGRSRKKPRKGTSKKKKKKMTKAQRAELKRQEEARKLREKEEETARLDRERAEQEEQERVARQAQEERDRLEFFKKEEEEAEVVVWLGEREVHVEAWEARERGEEEWGRYTACQTRPDPGNESEINTYINMWQDEEELHMDHVLDKIQESETIIADAERLLAYAQERNDRELSARLIDNLVTLRDVTDKKLDQMTAFMIQHADEFAVQTGDENTPERLDCRLERTLPDIRYGLWVNLSPNLRAKDVTFDSIGCSTTICRQLALANIAIRICYVSFDNLTHTSVSDEYTTLGGILHFDILAVPPPPKTLNAWKLRPMTALAADVSRLGYPIVPPGTDPANVPVTPSASWPALRVVYTLPENVLVRDDEPTMGWWDRENLMWRTDGIENVHFDPKTREITFETIHAAPTAVLQAHYMDLPFMYWMLVPAGPNKAQLTLSGAVKEVVIEIGEGYCRLIKPLDDCLSELRTGRYSPYLLMLKLARAGINMIPTDAAVPYLSTRGVKLKDIAMEDLLHAEMSLVAPAFAMSWCKWNSERSAKKAVLKLVEVIDAKARLPEDDDWHTVMYDYVHREAYTLKAKDDTEHFTEERSDGAELHRNIYTCVKESCSHEAVMICRAASDRFSCSVKHILNLVRPFSFA